MGSRKALFFDVDGTLLSEMDGGIPQSAVQAVEEARKKGHLAFINSGRVFKLLEGIKEMIPMDGFLCGCGTSIILGEQELYSRRVPHQRGLEIKELLVQYRVEGILEGKEGCHFRKDRSWMPRLEKIRQTLGKINAVSVHSIEEDSYDFDKFCCVTDENSDIKGFIQAAEDFEVIDRGNHFWECVPKGHSKATAIQKVLDHYAIPLEDAYVFGDSTNDLSMFTYAKNTVLMGKHDKELEPYASFTTKTVEDDGIFYAMKTLGII